MATTQTTSTGGWKARDKAYRARQNERARHNRRMRSDPSYRSDFVAQRVKEGEARHAEHIRPAREAKARRVLAAFGCTPEWAEALTEATKALKVREAA